VGRLPGSARQDLDRAPAQAVAQEATLSAQLYTAAKAGGFVELVDRGTFRLRPTTA
jgi:hypothetical protein